MFVSVFVLILLLGEASLIVLLSCGRGQQGGARVSWAFGGHTTNDERGVAMSDEPSRRVWTFDCRGLSCLWLEAWLIKSEAIGSASHSSIRWLQARYLRMGQVHLVSRRNRSLKAFGCAIHLSGAS